MKKVFTVFSGLALVAAIGVANGADNKGSVTGVIKETDAAKATIVLKDGTRLTLAEGVNMQDLKPGHEVTVSYEMKGSEKIGTSVAPEYFFLTE